MTYFVGLDDHHFMTHVDDIHQTRTQQIILLRTDFYSTMRRPHADLEERHELRNGTSARQINSSKEHNMT